MSNIKFNLFQYAIHDKVISTLTERQEMKPKLLAPIKITDKQRDWLESEQKRTGNAISVIVRGLIQDKVEGESRK